MACFASGNYLWVIIDPIVCGDPIKGCVGMDTTTWLFYNLWSWSSWTCDLVGDDYSGDLPDDYGVVQTELSLTIR